MNPVVSPAGAQVASVLPVRFHPATDQLIAESDAWVRELVRPCFRDTAGMERYLDGEIAAVCCAMLPGMPYAVARPMCDLFQYIVVIDDALGDAGWVGGSVHASRLVVEQVMAAVSGWGRVEDTTRAARDAVDRLRPHLDEPRWRRFLVDFEDMLDGYLIEVSTRGEDGLSDLDAYARRRRVTVAMKWYLTVAELGHGEPMSERVATDERVLALREVVLDHLWLTNDMYSCAKERRGGEYISLIPLLERLEGTSPEECVAWIAQRVVAQEREFLDRVAALRAGELAGEPGLEEYFDNLTHIMSGPLHWSPGTRRYQVSGREGERRGAV
ncbi:terpene synthase family protein [Streptomyces sp. NBC_01233]|uniref:terpene synthase family protein n=1 Tax=Streptomyces sp. NBC_01233 TaxID=2903787 RepID=UPI002E0E5446|nr:terpene synthase family protein [Streptomyces sp. NBC_01233]